MKEVEYSDKHSKKEGQKNKSRRSIIPKLIDKVKEDVRSVLTIGAIVLTSITASLIATSPNPVYGLDPITLPEGTRVLGQEVMWFYDYGDSGTPIYTDTLALFYQDSTREIHPFNQEGYVVVEDGDTLKTVWRSDTLWTAEAHKIIVNVYGVKLTDEQKEELAEKIASDDPQNTFKKFVWHVFNLAGGEITGSGGIPNSNRTDSIYYALEDTTSCMEFQLDSESWFTVCVLPPTDTFLISSLSIREGRNIPKHIEGEVYPNPTNSRIKIKTDGEIQRGYILDQTGRIVREFKEKEIDLSKLNSGRYYIVWVKEDKYYVSEITLVK